MRNDAFENLLNSLVFAGHFNIPEVVIVFRDKVLRGNRAKKLDCESLDCFESPNFPALATFGIDIEI